MARTHYRNYDDWKLDTPPYYDEPELEDRGPDPDAQHEAQIDRQSEHDRDQGIGTQEREEARELTEPCVVHGCPNSAEVECPYCRKLVCLVHEYPNCRTGWTD